MSCASNGPIFEVSLLHYQNSRNSIASQLEEIEMFPKNSWAKSWDIFARHNKFLVSDPMTEVGGMSIICRMNPP